MLRLSVKFKGRFYRHFDRIAFGGALSELDWSEYYNLTNPVDALSFILKGVTRVLDKICPLPEFQVKNYRPNFFSLFLFSVLPAMIQLYIAGLPSMKNLFKIRFCRSLYVLTRNADHKVENNMIVHLMYYLSESLIKSQRYKHYCETAPNHQCLSLT